MTGLFSVDCNCTTQSFDISCFLAKNAFGQSINKDIRKMHAFLHKTRKEIAE
jgi:hypothetical protein